MIKIRSRNRNKEAVVNSVKSGDALLDLFEAHQIKLPFGCRSGSCGACRVKVFKGLELLSEKGPIESDTLANCKDPEDIRLSCQASPLPGISGEIEIEVAPDVCAPVI
jgi:ferredoxin